MGDPFQFHSSKILLCRSFTCLIRVTSRYFTLFVAIVKGDVSLISFSAHISSATLLKVFMGCRTSLVNFWGHLCILSHCQQIVSLTFSFLIWIPLISFCCLIALARTSSTVLNRYRESEQPCLVPGFTGIALNFSSFSLMLACCILPLLCLGMFIVSLLFPRLLS